MRILLATTSGAGHFGPLLPFGAALRAQGHELAVAAPRSFAAAVERAGYPYLPCDDVLPEELAAAYEGMAEATVEEQNQRVAMVFASLAPRAILPGMLDAVTTWRPDLLIREFGELGSFVAAEAHGVPQIQVMIGLRRFHDQTFPAIRHHLGPLAADHGVSVDRLGDLPTAGQLPLSFEEPGDGIEVHRFRAPAEPPLPPVEPDLVYVSFGSVSASVPFAARAFRTVVETLAALPLRLLVTIGDEGDPAEWTWAPSNVRVEKWVPQREALHGVAAYVTHGGMGSVLGSLTAGVPMVVVPQFADHPDNGARVEALGAGLCVPADEVGAAVRRVLDEPSFRAAAGRVAAEIAALPEAGEVLRLV